MRHSMNVAGATSTSMNGIVLLTGTVAGPSDIEEAQKLVEQSEQAVGRWRAKAAVAGATVGSTAANPLRGVTAQPGNPLR